jgi:hypothetical protein
LLPAIVSYCTKAHTPRKYKNPNIEIIGKKGKEENKISFTNKTQKEIQNLIIEYQRSNEC